MINFIVRVFKYTFVRTATLLLMVVVSVFLTVFIANLGGYIDTVIRSNIDEGLGLSIRAGWLKDVTDQAERERIFEETRLALYDSAGLNQPFLLRCIRWTWNGLMLDWGTAGQRVTLFGIPSSAVRVVILDALPRTLLVFGLANFLLLLSSIFLALGATRRYGSWLDRLVTLLSPMAAAPSWVYGLILAAVLIHVWHTGFASFTEWPREFSWAYLPFYAKHMLPPIIAIFLSKFFQSVYSWRTFFLIHSSEDYVEMARAKGLEGRIIERRYILRPALPNVLTSFALLVISLWQEVILLETIFSVGGVGRLFYIGITGNDIRLIVGLVVTFAYMLALTVFVLDILYALVDPRVKVGGDRQSATSVSLEKNGGLLRWWRKSEKKPGLQEVPAGWLSRFDGQASPGAAGLSSQWAARPSLGRRILRGLRSLGELRRYPPVLVGQTILLALIAFSVYTIRFIPFLVRQMLRGLRALGELRRYPPILLGVTIISLLIAISAYTILFIPYQEAVIQWRGDFKVWEDNPTYAPPAWVNLFRADDLPETITLDSRDGWIKKTRRSVSEEMAEILLTFPIEYPYAGGFPQDLTLFFDVHYDEKRPHLFFTWVTPDGRELDMGNFSMASNVPYHPFLDEQLKRKLAVHAVRDALFGDPSNPARPLTGHYELRVKAYVFEDAADLDIKLVVYGMVHGLAGTDGRRRDVMLGLLWGTPVALAFGLLAAVGTSLSTMTIAAIGAWFGGRVDDVIQRLTEVNMLIPFFPISLMIYTLYSKSFWVILGVTVLLSIFGSSIKNYRAVFLQLKESPYIEAARSYGAGDWRIVFRYLIPRIGSMLVPQLVMLVPSYVFLEAALTSLGLYDPLTPPTWGQLVLDGLGKGLYNDAYHLALEPAVLLVLTGFSFLLLGFSLERILEPRLRNM